MNPHDYVITVDENGDVHLEHALFNRQKGQARKNHKYYKRVPTVKGFEYFYSEKEYQNWLNGRNNKNSNNNAIKPKGERMRESLRKATETTKGLASKAADKLGFDERQRLQNANFFNREKRQNEYDKTPLGKAENLANKAKDLATDAAEATAEKAKALGERVKTNAKNKVENMKETFRKNKEQLDKAEEMDKADAEREAKLANRPTAHEKNIAGEAKEGAIYKRERNSDSIDIHSKADRGDYSKNDPDFDDANYDKADRVGDTNFLTFKRKDGTSVILEEDMKWVLPKGVDGSDPEIKQAIENFERTVASYRESDPSAFHGDAWDKEIQRSLDQAIADVALRKNSANKPAKYSSYTDGDSDFDDDNYKESGRVGDSDFFVHKRSDGTNVILEEDMKWVLPKGIDAKSPEIQKAIQKIVDDPASVIGKKNYTASEWAEATTNLLNEAAAGNGNSSKSSGRINPSNVSFEYLSDLAYNRGVNSGDLRVLEEADQIHYRAQQAYNRALKNPNTTSQEKERLFRALTKAEQDYNEIAEEIIDQL